MQEQVLEALRQKNLDVAATLCAHWRTLEPSSAVACNLSGAVALHADRLPEAIQWFEVATHLDPTYAKAWSNLGLAYEQANKKEAALVCHKKAHALAPTVLEIKANLLRQLHGMGAYAEMLDVLESWPKDTPLSADLGWLSAQAAHGLGDLELACRIMGNMTKQYPENADLWRTYADLLRELGLGQAAEDAYLQAVALNPEDAVSYHELGRLLVRRGNSARALPYLKSAYMLSSNDPDILCDLAHALMDSGLFLDAKKILRQGMDKWPRHAEICYQLAHLEGRHGDRQLATKLVRQAATLDPTKYVAQNYMAELLLHDGRVNEAKPYVEAALALDPTRAEAYNSLGNLYWQNLELEAAEKNYRRAIELNPAFHEARHNLGLLLLLRGEFQEGWTYYESRLEIAEAKPHARRFHKPLWQGEPLRHKRLLVHAEQGYGDTIQFVRYLEILSRLGAEVIFETPYPLKRLLQRVAGIRCLIERGEPLPDFDCHIPLLSIPSRLHTDSNSIPVAAGAYLIAADEEAYKWKQRVSALPAGLRVGIAWAGNPKHGNDSQRSLSLEDLCLLEHAPPVHWVNLTKQPPGSVRNTQAPSFATYDWTSELDDYLDTAALISQLDLVISVDTSVAHLAGALGKQVWIMLPYVPDWRWQLGRGDSPWYPTVRLFRQESKGDWKHVMQEVANELERY